MKESIKKLITGYVEIEKEIAVLRESSPDYSLQKGIWRDAVDKLHPKRLKFQVSEIHKEIESVSTLRLTSLDRHLPPFQAGQYINLQVQLNGIMTSRPYSISSAPCQTDYYDITVKRIPNGFVSDYLLDQVKVGDTFTSTGPAGYFYYNPLFHGKKLVFLAGGSGITPFMSMIRDVTDRGLERQIHLIYGCRTPGDAIFHQELTLRAQRHSTFTYDLVISEPGPGYSGLKGFIGADIINNLAIPVNSSMFYVCGPAAMYEHCISELYKLEVPKRRIRQEIFGVGSKVYQDPAWPSGISPEAAFVVHLSDGRQIPARATESVLVAMERAGIVIENCCRSGECSLCRVKLVSGKVFQPSGALVRKSDHENGYIHSCAAYPLSDLEILV